MEGENGAFFLLHLLIAVWSFNCISVKLPEPACVNPPPPAARPPCPISLAFCTEIGLSEGDFQTQTARTPDGPGTRRRFPAETRARCRCRQPWAARLCRSCAPRGRRSLYAPDRKADNAHFLIFTAWEVPSVWGSAGKNDS